MQHTAAAAPGKLSPTVDFENVRFSYPGGRGIALDGVTFSLAAGERIGVVGPSGSGKSTVARLLLHLYEAQDGAVKIGGSDIRVLDPDRAREQIAVVQQDTYLFHGTIEDNLRLGKQNATQAELEEAARAADAHEFIAGLPQGYQTIIGERGARLSGGQRQRIAIARALLRDAPILILDEAMSSVDAETEATIQKALDRLMTGRTVLVLAHRLSSVIGTDRILVVEQGKIVESGSHDVLIRRDGAYRRLMGAQADEREGYTGVLAAHAAEDELATEELSEIEDDGEEADSDPARRQAALGEDPRLAERADRAVVASARRHDVLGHRPRRDLHQRRRVLIARGRRGEAWRRLLDAALGAVDRRADLGRARLVRGVAGA